MQSTRLLSVICATLLGAPIAIAAQNPISSKIVGSDVARRNRKLVSKRLEKAPAKGDTIVGDDSVAAAYLRTLVTRGVMTPAEAAAARADFASRVPVVGVRRMFASEVAEYLRLTNPSDTLALDSPERWQKLDTQCVSEALGGPVQKPSPTQPLKSAHLLELLCRSSELSSVVPNAIRLALGKTMRKQPAVTMAAYRADALGADAALVEVIAADALTRVLRAVEKGHTNPQRFYLGGQLGMRLVGGDNDNGILGRASVRAAYFIPVSPLAYYQLPVVTNLGDVAAAPEESQADKLKKLTTASEGAFVSIEPTFDPVYLGSLKDMRVQFFGAVGGQVNTLRDKDDKEDVQVAQGRVGAGANIEIGNASTGRPNLFLSTRVIGRFASPSALEKVFGSRDRLKPVLESFALIPIGSGVSILGEVSATRGSAPVVRIALWAQATPQKGP